MKELKDFKQTGEYSDNDIRDSELLSGVMGKYGDMNEEQLIGELKKAVSAAKEDGSFSEESLENFFALVSPQLGDEQREKLRNLISVIKLGD